jgi:alginate O-acetyltransferase complex protein AlgI
MLFSSITFLYYFLPAVLIVYFLVPFKYKNLIILMVSLLFYAWGEPLYSILMVGSILQGYFMGLRIESFAGRKQGKYWMITSIVISLVILGFFKYYDFFIQNFNEATDLSLPVLSIALPMGISFYTFHIMSYVIDVHRGNIKAERSLITFMAYSTLFAQLVAGPIVRYADIAEQLHNRRHSLEQIYCGSRRFVVGLSKKVLLANSFGLLVTQFIDSEEKSILFFWLYAIAFTLQIYYDFSGYSDMAIGLGQIFGFRFLENFQYPYIAKSITEFWRRWHISLSSWFRDYVYIPMGGNRVSKRRQVFNLLVVWMLTGLWHGAAWNFIIWGLYFAILLILEKFCLFKCKLKVSTLFSHIYVMVLVMISFVLFNAENLGQAVGDISGMFGLTGIGAVTQEALYYLKSYLILLVIGIIGATPFAGKLYLSATKDKLGSCIALVLEPIVLVGLLLVITGYLVDGSFNPFLYFRF